MFKNKRLALVILIIILIFLSIFAFKVFDNENDESVSKDIVEYSHNLYECDLSSIPSIFLKEKITDDLDFISFSRTDLSLNYIPSCLKVYIGNYENEQPVRVFYSVSNKSIVEIGFDFYDTKKVDDSIVFTSEDKIFVTDLDLQNEKDILSGIDSLKYLISTPRILFNGVGDVYIVFKGTSEHGYDLLYDISDCLPDFCKLSDATVYSDENFYLEIIENDEVDFEKSPNMMEYYPRATSPIYHFIDSDKFFIHVGYYNDYIGVWDVKNNELLEDYKIVEYLGSDMEFPFTVCNQNFCIVYYPLSGRIVKYSVEDFGVEESYGQKIEIEEEELAETIRTLDNDSSRLLYFKDDKLFLDLIEERYEIEY